MRTCIHVRRKFADKYLWKLISYVFYWAICVQRTARRLYFIRSPKLCIHDRYLAALRFPHFIHLRIKKHVEQINITSNTPLYAYIYILYIIYTLYIYIEVILRRQLAPYLEVSFAPSVSQSRASPHLHHIRTKIFSCSHTFRLHFMHPQNIP